MNNTNAFAACVWCGVSLLRGPVVVKLQPKREAPRPWRFVLPKREREGSTPSPRTFFLTKLFVIPGLTWSDKVSPSVFRLGIISSYRLWWSANNRIQR